MKRAILIASMGNTPQVLTEMVWELAHQDRPCLPDEIVLLAAKNSAEKARRELLDGGEDSVWKKMLRALMKEGADVAGKLKFGTASIAIIPDECGDEMQDLRSGDDSLSAADFILGQIRRYTESPDTVVYVSIAGGRKTMSALMFSCMTLLGREDDKVLHVLPPKELEGGSLPTFYFPQRGVLVQSCKTLKKYRADKLRSELLEVPFVRMRGWYQDKFKELPPTYRRLVSSVQKVSPDAIVHPALEIDAWNGVVRVNGKEIRPGALEFAALIMLSSGISDLNQLYKKLHRLRKVVSVGECIWLEKLTGTAKFKSYVEEQWREQNQEVSKVLSPLRKLLGQSGYDLESLVPMRGAAVSYPLDSIQWKNRDKLLDICGYLFSPDGKKHEV